MAHHRHHRNKVTPTPHRYFLRRTIPILSGTIELPGLYDQIATSMTVNRGQMVWTKEVDKNGRPIHQLGWT